MAIYLGKRKQGDLVQFRSPIIPTKESHGHLYTAVIGPFKTARRSRTPSCPARSPRAGSATSASAPARTCASCARRDWARRVHPERHGRRGVPARAGTRSRFPWRRPRTGPSSSWAPDRPEWNAPWCSAGGASRPSTSSRRRTPSAVASAGRGACRRWATRGRVADWRATQLGGLANVEVITGRTLTVADILDYGASIVVIATGSAWSDNGAQPGQPPGSPASSGP